MNSLRQLFVGLVTALSSSLLVLAAISLALAEGSLSATPVSPSSEITVTQASPLPGETLQFTQPPAATNTPVEPTPCLPPAGWTPYTVQSGDTLEVLANQAGLPTEEFSKANCLRSASLPVGSVVYLPPLQITTTPTETPPPPLPTLQATDTPFVCPPPPPGWIIHIVESGETLYRLGQAYGVTAGYLQQVNCLPSTYIVTGRRLYVPNVPTRTPIFRPTVTPSPTFTSEPPTETETPTETSTSTPTETQNITPSPQVTVSATTDTTPAGNTGSTNPTDAAGTGGASTVLPATQSAPPANVTGTPTGTSPATQ